MSYERYVDDFCITKGNSVYTGNFTPSEKTYVGGGTSGFTTQKSSGNQNSGLLVNQSDVMDISKGDFTIELPLALKISFKQYRPASFFFTSTILPSNFSVITLQILRLDKYTINPP